MDDVQKVKPFVDWRELVKQGIREPLAQEIAAVENGLGGDIDPPPDYPMPLPPGMPKPRKPQTVGKALGFGWNDGLLVKYSDDEARDEHGRWTAEGGGDAPAGPQAVAPAANVRDTVRGSQHHTRALADLTSGKATREEINAKIVALNAKAAAALAERNRIGRGTDDKAYWSKHYEAQRALTQARAYDQALQDHAARTGQPPAPAPKPAAKDDGGTGIRPAADVKVQWMQGPRSGGIEDARRILRRPDLTEEQLARCAGALDGATVHVNVMRTGTDAFYSTRVFMTVEHPDIEEANRAAFIDNHGKLTMSNQYLRIKPDAPEGTGTQFFARQVDGLRAVGFDHISTTAAQGPTYNGYYTWARLGYDARLENTDAHDNHYEELKGRFPNAVMISDLMKAPGGREWWKANGSDWDGKFDLKTDSTSMQVLRGYVKEKGYKKSVQSPLPQGAHPLAGGQQRGDEITLTAEDEAILDRVWANQARKA